MVWVLVAIGLVIGASVLVAAIGAMLPKQHSVSRRALFNRQPNEMWEVIADIPGQVSWRGDLGHVERLPQRSGHEVWRETDRRGQALTLETIESVRPHRLVRKITDNRMFGGNWTYEIGEHGEVTSMTITENGEVYNPVVRFMSRFIIGQTSTIDNYLTALGKRLGVEVTITGV